MPSLLGVGVDVLDALLRDALGHVAAELVQRLAHLLLVLLVAQDPLQCRHGELAQRAVVV